jgi:hypothetical protein
MQQPEGGGPYELLGGFGTCLDNKCDCEGGGLVIVDCFQFILKRPPFSSQSRAADANVFALSPAGPSSPGGKSLMNRRARFAGGLQGQRTRCRFSKIDISRAACKFGLKQRVPASRQPEILCQQAAASKV